MYYSIFDLFKIGIGPSSSHTVGPIIASNRIVEYIIDSNNMQNLINISVELKGSLAFTAHGHKTIDGILIGLTGTKPEDINTEILKETLLEIKETKEIIISNKYKIPFDFKKDIKLNKTNNTDEIYNNVIHYQCTYSNKSDNFKKTFFSVGGGFVVEKGKTQSNSKHVFPFDFNSSIELLQLCKKNKTNIHDIVLSNELSLISDKDMLSEKILTLWNTMSDIISTGISNTGLIDDILKVERRANKLYNKLKRNNHYDPLELMDWINIFAIATCEENASGAKIVTAPTNGAAGIIPAVLKYYVKFINNSNNQGIINFICTATAIGTLFKNNASISGAEVGCQGEVGVACSMAAAGLTASLGGTCMQIENAAEIGMEHNLGLTCDPVKGLVQIPCIERNSMGAIQAINASRLALNGTGDHKVSLDQVIKTMNDTGRSMSAIYKETALGGLAVNVIEC